VVSVAAASVAGASRLIPLPHDQAPALLLIELKFRDGSSFGGFLVRCVRVPDVLGTRPQDRDVPSPELGGGGGFLGLACCRG
jgi:hypothetical protein